MRSHTDWANSDRPTVVWLNGAFGAGKTAVAERIVDRLGHAVLVDPEEIGSLLRSSLQQVAPRRDFQDWEAWRHLTVASVAHIAVEAHGAAVIVPQTVLVERYWKEIAAGLSSRARLVPVCLHVDADAHARRVRTDRREPDARGWRLRRFDDYRAAAWLPACFDMVDNTEDDIDRTVDAVVELVPDHGAARELPRLDASDRGPGR